MSSTDTKWKKKIKGINNKEGLENKAENGKTTRDEKDEAQTKMLDELKNRLRNIQNKRKGFTKLPHLTDIAEDNDETDKDETDKDGFKEGGGVNKDETDKDETYKDGFKEGKVGGGGGRGGESGYINTILDKLFKDDKKKLDSKQIGFIEWFTDFYSHAHWRLGTSYFVFLIAYLQLYHLNFKEDIKSNFPDDYKEADTPASTELPREWGAITANILDSLTKTIGTSVWDKQYINIEHNLFLKNMNTIARFGMKYLFLPTQVVVAITQNLIPNLNLLISKNVFPLIFVLSFVSIFGMTYIGSVDVLKKEREKEMNREQTDFVNAFKTYYAIIPFPYFILVLIIILIAYGLDFTREMGDGTYFKDGIIAAVAKFLITIFSISMSVVLSGFSAIPLGFFALMWIIIPEGIGKPPGKYAGLLGFTKWSNAIRDNYWLPEWDVCEESQPTKWARYFIRKLWNNKILISFLVVLDAVFKLRLGNGDFNKGRQRIYGQPLWWIWYGVVPILTVLLMWQPAIRTKAMFEYLTGIHTFLKTKITQQ